MLTKQKNFKKVAQRFERYKTHTELSYMGAP